MDPVTALFLAMGVLSMFSGRERGSTVAARLQHFLPQSNNNDKALEYIKGTQEYAEMEKLKRAIDTSYYTKDNFKHMKEADKGGIFSKIFFGLFDELLPVSDWIHAQDYKNNQLTDNPYQTHSYSGGKDLANKYEASVSQVTNMYHEKLNSLNDEGRNDLLHAQGLVKL